ncbi:caspase family protein [Parasedimentitalea marina]|uniref:Caspase family protein n=1 Tax=Parasedimentitalea marina TaxID=2483033 RepID=A0A3T0N770_9RHOB|nr:caspase family protein [Parasedimentitalea marina]AZV79880.1 caspase family protein [Parasedimentitalea marina]
MSNYSFPAAAYSKAVRWVALCLMLLPIPALAGNRYALIVGNAAYSTLPPLQNTIADAEAYADLFKELGYDVTSLSDLNRSDMEFALVDFLDQIKTGDTAVFVYSGHGWSDGKTNFLLPTDVTMQGSERRMRLMSIPLQNGLDGIVDQIRQAGASVQVAIIDACRNNIFGKDGTKSIGMTRGLSVERAPQGAFLIFSAGSGEESLDRLSTDDAGQKLSVFTRHFLPRLRAGMYLEDAINAAQLETAEAARSYNNHQQNPAYYDQINGKLCLSGSCTNDSQPAAITAAAARPVVTVDCGEARSVWADVKNAQDAEILNQFAEIYAECKVYAGLAAAKAATLASAAAPAAVQTETASIPISLPRPNINWAKCVSGGSPVKHARICVESVLSSQAGNTYWPDNMIDHSNQTAWVEGVKGHGTGQRLLLEFDHPTVVSGIDFINGYAKSHSSFKNNSRVESIRVSDSTQDWQRISLKDTPDWQSFQRDGHSPVRWIMFEIQSVYPGAKWADTAISEMRLR